LFLTVTALSPTNAPLTYEWTIVSGPAGAHATLVGNGNTATFSTSTIGNYTLKVAATDLRGRVASLTFPVHVGDGPLCDLKPGEDTVKTVRIPGHSVRGAPFPPFNILPNEERNEQPVRRVPNGPLLGNLQPTFEGINALVPSQGPPPSIGA